MAGKASVGGVAPITLGLLGVGTMNAAIARGLLALASTRSDLEKAERKISLANGSAVKEPILLSTRGERNTSSLLREAETKGAEYERFFEISEDNASLVRRADVVVVGLLPEQTIKVCKDLPFHHGQVVINLASTVSNDELLAALKTPGGVAVTKAVPQPAVADLAGVTIVSPAHPVASQLFSAMGTVVEVEKRESMLALQAATAMMGPLYETILTLQRWLVAQGVDDRLAAVCEFLE